jgi:glycosyltransferase
MKNIFLFDELISSSRNGIGTYLKQLILSLERLNININIIALNSSKDEFEIEIKNGIKTFNFPHLKSGSFINHPSIINNILQLHIEDSINNIFFLNHSPCEEFIKCLKKSHPLSKIIFTIHDQGWTGSLLGDVNILKNILSKHNTSIEQKHSPLIRYFKEEQQMYNISDKVICLSEDTFSLLNESYKISTNKIELIKNGVFDSFYPLDKKAKDRIRKRLFIPIKEKVILYIGRVQTSKGCETLLSSFKQVLRRYPNCRLVMAGTLYNPDLFLNKCKSVSSKISFTGQISKEELQEWLYIADIGILPSYTEQCSYVGIEMMMYGLPIVASDGWGVRNMFKNGYNAITAFSKKNNTSSYEDKLSFAIIKLLESAYLRRSLSQNARSEFEQKYHISIMQNKYEELIKNI